MKEFFGNACRMDYSYYKKTGAEIIGAGVIELAHRTVVQKRMKQSGQRWSYASAQNMLNLRIMGMNGQFILNLYKFGSHYLICKVYLYLKSDEENLYLIYGGVKNVRRKVATVLSWKNMVDLM